MTLPMCSFGFKLKANQVKNYLRFPIINEAHLKQNKPDYVLIMQWSLREEVMVHLSYIREWGGQFVTAVPELKVE